MADITPVTRKEKILAGADITPVTREEALLKEIIDSGGGGGGGESVIAWKPKVEADGTISWTRTASTTKPADQNIKGDKGDKGDTGATGAKGDTGEKGADGAKGDKGDDGYSPTITVTEITGGHRVTVTDATGSRSFDVMDGEGGSGGDVKAFVAEYNVTTAQEIIAYIDSTNEPFPPILIKRGSDYYTAITAQKQADNKVILRSFATLSGDYYIFMYTITDGLWAASNYPFQKKLESGTNIKTINGQSVIGSGNLILHQGVGDGLDLNDMPSYNELQQMLDNNALLYIDGNWLVTGLMVEGSNAQVIGAYADSVRYYLFDTNDDPNAPLVYKNTYTEGSSQKPNMVVSAGGTQPFGKFQRGDGQEFLLFGLANGINITFTDQQGRTQNRSYTITPSYVVDKPEGSTPVSGNVVQVGLFTDTDGTEYGIYEFYYRTSALPAADATKVYPLTPLLDDYTILDFVDATGVTENGHFIGSGRTDGTNRIIVQQFSKNNKTFTMRSYGDYTQYTALVKIKFVGTKNV
ncbi:MAG: collagen-like protein [Lachnospiraceae bacterium]|nr:collagen-like protein [Lachnospiraceae bacterium]